jgi:hypothetical protein
LETGEDSDSTEWSLEPGEMEEEDECNFSEEEEEVRVEKEIQNPKKREAPYFRDGKKLELPTRCVEFLVPTGRPASGRGGIALNAGDIRSVLQKISDGVDQAQKIISFRFVRGEGVLDVKEEWVEEKEIEGAMKEGKIRSEILKYCPGTLPDSRLIKAIKDINVVMRMDPSKIDDTIPDLVYNLLTGSPAISHQQALYDLERKMKEVTEDTTGMVSRMEEDCKMKLERKDRELKMMEVRVKSAEKELAKSQEECKTLRDKYVKKEEEFGKLKEWCEKTREENKEARRKSVSKENERRGSADVIEKGSDGPQRSMEPKDKEIRKSKEEEKKAKSEENQSGMQESRVSKLEEQVTDLRKAKDKILQIIQPEHLVIRVPDELGEVPAGLQNCKHKAWIEISGPDLELVQLYDPSGVCQVVATEESVQRGITLQRDKRKGEDGNPFRKGKLLIKVLYNPRLGNRWAPWKAGESLGRIEFPFPGRGVRVRVDGVVKIPWRLEDEADQASVVQAGEIKKKPRSEGGESKEKRISQEEERRQRGPQEREKGREYQPRGWGYKGSSSYHYPY